MPVPNPFEVCLLPAPRERGPAPRSWRRPREAAVVRERSWARPRGVATMQAYRGVSPRHTATTAAPTEGQRSGGLACPEGECHEWRATRSGAERRRAVHGLSRRGMPARRGPPTTVTARALREARRSANCPSVGTRESNSTLAEPSDGTALAGPLSFLALQSRKWRAHANQGRSSKPAIDGARIDLRCNALHYSTHFFNSRDGRKPQSPKGKHSRRLAPAAARAASLVSGRASDSEADPSERPRGRRDGRQASRRPSPPRWRANHTARARHGRRPIADGEGARHGAAARHERRGR